MYDKAVKYVFYGFNKIFVQPEVYLFKSEEFITLRTVLKSACKNQSSDCKCTFNNSFKCYSMCSVQTNMYVLFRNSR